MSHRFHKLRWRVSKDQYYRVFRRWSVTLWDYRYAVPGSCFIETRHFWKFDNALKFALSSEAEQIRQSYLNT